MLHKIINEHNADVIPLSVKALKLASNEKIEIIKLKLTPGERIEKHKNNLQVIFYVLKGKIILGVENENFTMESGDSIAVTKDLQRSVRNTGMENSEVLVIKSL